MHKYGHMLKPNDRTYHTANGRTHLVVVKDVWKSKMYPHTRWVELWTYSTLDIERPLLVVLTDDFAGWNVEPATATDPYVVHDAAV
jgi:hypothetical protein